MSTSAFGLPSAFLRGAGFVGVAPGQEELGADAKPRSRSLHRESVQGRR